MSREIIRFQIGGTENWDTYKYKFGYRDQASFAKLEDDVITEWEGLEDKGVVRLVTQHDHHWSFEDLEGDCYNPEVNDDIDPKELKRQQRNFRKRVSRAGVYGLTSEYKDAEGNWQDADACWGFVGNDWQNSGYDMDIMRGAIDGYRKANLIPLNEVVDDHLDEVGA